MSGFILILNGPPDNGQAQVAKILLDRPGRFHVPTNKIKFLISDYDAQKTNRDDLNQIIFDLAESARRQNDYSLVVDGSIAILRKWRVMYEQLAKYTYAAFVEVNIEGPYPLLLKRFQDRVARSQKDGTRISISTEAEFKERFDAYVTLKKPDLPTFSAVLSSPEHTAQQIEKLLVQT